MSPDDVSGAAEYRFAGLFVPKSIFEVVGTVTSNVTGPKTVAVGLEVGASAALLEDGHAAFVKIEIKIIPDQTIQPYRIEVTIAATFTTTNASQDQMLIFCQQAAPSILFPYIREIVHRMTMDAPHGVVRLDPVNISAMLNKTQWDVSTHSEAPVSDAIGS